MSFIVPYLCYILCQTFYIYYFISFYNFITPPSKSYYYSHFYKREIIADIAVPLLKSNLSSISSLSPAMTPSAHRNIHRRKVIKWKTFFFFLVPLQLHNKSSSWSPWVISSAKWSSWICTKKFTQRTNKQQTNRTVIGFHSSWVWISMQETRMFKLFLCHYLLELVFSMEFSACHIFLKLYDIDFTPWLWISFVLSQS